MTGIKVDRAGIIIFLAMVVFWGCNDKQDEDATGADYLKYCSVDSAKTGYELAGEYDHCVGMFAQLTTAYFEPNDVDVRVNYLSAIDFYSARARLSIEEKWIQAYYNFAPEEMSGVDDAPSEITGAVVLKLKTKESIDKAFGPGSSDPQGRCADVQQVIYDNVLNTMLTPEEKSSYTSEGRKIVFIPDDDPPPLDETTNPAANGGIWLERDPAGQVIDQGDSVSYEPPAFYSASDDPTLPAGIDEGLKGVMYCKLLSHQIILHWMRVRSFEQGAIPIAPMAGDACLAPHSFDARYGSCVFYFPAGLSYYCSDYTGYGFDKESAMRKCESRASNETLTTEYSKKQCDQRLDEIESKIPDFAGFQGLCVIHCQEEGEFLWNVYQENPEPRCSNYPFLSAEEKDLIQNGSD